MIPHEVLAAKCQVGEDTCVGVGCLPVFLQPFLAVEDVALTLTADVNVHGVAALGFGKVEVVGVTRADVPDEALPRLDVFASPVGVLGTPLEGAGQKPECGWSVPSSAVVSS